MGGSSARPRRRVHGGHVLGLALLLVVATAARAEEPAAGAPDAPAAAAAPAPGPAAPPADTPSLDKLLKLPAGTAYGGERRGGQTRGQWASRFVGLRRALEEERRGLENARRERERIAGSADPWLLGPPGASAENAPLDFRLRQEVRRHREEIERLEQRLKELEVEANLADVPAEWRE